MHCHDVSSLSSMTMRRRRVRTTTRNQRPVCCWPSISQVRSFVSKLLFLCGLLWLTILQKVIMSPSTTTKRALMLKDDSESLVLTSVDVIPRINIQIAKNNSTFTIISTAEDVSNNNNNASTKSLLDGRNIPLWMKEYLIWHTQQRKQMYEQNWLKNKYLILTCVNGRDKECGGVADRLKPIPFLLAIAYKSNRIFLIRWTKPTKLEEFLLPNTQFINWSVPIWMEHSIETMRKEGHHNCYNSTDNIIDINDNTDTNIETIKSGHPSRKHNLYYKYTRGSKNIARIYKTTRQVVWEVNTQDIFGGCALYQQVITDSVNKASWKNKNWDPRTGWDLYQHIYHDLFRTIFTPSPPIEKLVTDKMKSANLIPGMYSMAHYRAFYAIEDRKHKRKEKDLKQFAIHAVNCAYFLRPGVPVYFASDSRIAIDAVNEYAQQLDKNINKSIITFSEGAEKEPLHIDKPVENETKVSDYYSIFVDLLLMANGKCLAFGEGGFGLYAALLSKDATCTRKHSLKRKLLDCTKNDSNSFDI